MKRRSSEIRIKAPKKVIEDVLMDAPSFVTNWPYVVRISMKKGLKAEIMMPRFIFRFRDIYTIEYHSDYNSHIYEGNGKNGYIGLVITLKEWQKHADAVLELSYKGRGEFWLGKTLQHFVDKIGRSLKELAEGKSIEVPAAESGEAAFQVDFTDPMSVAGFLSKSQMIHSGIHIIGEKGLFGLISELRGNIPNSILYVSGITENGERSFKVLLKESRILAIEVRDGNNVRTIKVENDDDARNALDIASKVGGTYMVNVWVPTGGV